MMIHDQPRFSRWLSDLGFDVDFVMNDQFLTESQCLKLSPIYDGWIAGDDEITADVINHLKKKLKIISKWGTGINSIDMSYCKKQGIEVRNTPKAFSDAVGEMVVAYLLALTRGVVETHQKVKQGKWPKKQYKTLKNLKVGFVGMGSIGRDAAKRLKKLGCKIFYSDPKIKVKYYQKRNIKNLFKQVDAIIITANLNLSTYKLINKKLFDLIKSEIFLINVSRGMIIDESCMIQAIKEKKIIGAALDVFEIEPINKDNKLLKFENVILGSHNANNIFENVEYVHKNTIETLVYNLKKNVKKKN